MARVSIRGLDRRTIERLKERASRNHRSLQAELRIILERASVIDVLESRTVAAHIRQKLSDRKYSDSGALIADDRQR